MQTRDGRRACPATRPRSRRSLRASAGLALAPLAVLAALACRGGEAEPARSGRAALVRIGAIEWYVDYAAALEVARQRDRPLWVHFGEHPG